MKRTLLMLTLLFDVALGLQANAQQENLIQANCEVLNPDEISKSSLSNYSIHPYNAVQIAYRPDDGFVALTLQLSAGRLSLKPRDPRVYLGKIKMTKNMMEKNVVLKNANREETDSAMMASDLSKGVISLYGAKLEVDCSQQ